MLSHKNFSFGADRESVEGILSAIRRQYNSKFNGISKMSYNPQKPWADGGIKLHGYTGTPDDVYPMYVGTKLEFMSGSRPDMLSDLDMTRMLAAIGHETGHLKDMLDYMRVPNDPVGLRLSAEVIATNDNQAYYSRNYTTNECEIRAERNGIEFARDMLTSLMNNDVLKHDGYNSAQECVEQSLVDYVNFRISASHDDYFISPKRPAKRFSKLSEIEAAFDDAVEKSVTTKRVYPGTKLAGIDVFPRVVGIAGQSGYPEYQCFGKMFKTAKSPYEQNLMISAIAAQGFSGDGRGGYFAKWFPALKDVLPIYPLTHGVGNPNVLRAHDSAFCQSMHNAFDDAEWRVCQKDPSFELIMPDKGIAPRIYEDCYNEAYRFRKSLSKDNIPAFFSKVVSDIKDKLARRDVGPEFDITVLNSEPSVSRNVSDLSL